MAIKTEVPPPEREGPAAALARETMEAALRWLERDDPERGLNLRTTLSSTPPHLQADLTHLIRAAYYMGRQDQRGGAPEPERRGPPTEHTKGGRRTLRLQGRDTGVPKYLAVNPAHVAYIGADAVDIPATLYLSVPYGGEESGMLVEVGVRDDFEEVARQMEAALEP